MSLDVYVSFPTQPKERITVPSLLTVKGLKAYIEELLGVPTELLSLQCAGRFLDDETRTLEDENISQNGEISTNVDVWWSKVVNLSMTGDVGSLRRRVSVPMQQTSAANRVFVSLFISASHGHATSVSAVLHAYPKFDLKTSSQVTQRTVLHAAVLSGNVRCVEEIYKHASKSFEDLLRLPDRGGRTPLDLASKLPDPNKMMNYLNMILNGTNETVILQNKIESDKIEVENLTKSIDTSPYSRDKLPHQNNVDPSSEQQDIERQGTFTLEDGRNDTDDAKLHVPVIKDTSTTRSASPLPLSRPHSPRFSPLQSKSNGAQQKEDTSITGDGNNHRTNLPNGVNLSPQGTTESLPAIGGVSPVSPRQRRRGSEILSSIPPSYEHSPEPPKSPRPANVRADPRIRRGPHDRSKTEPGRPVAGILASNPRKVSSTRPRSTSAGRPVSNRPAFHDNRPVTAEPVASSSGKLLTPAGGSVGRKISGEKVRRISLVKNPQRKLSPAPGDESNPGTHPYTAPVIEIEKDRIDKPWNNWIKAVTVDADSEEAKKLEQDNNSSQSLTVEIPKSRKTSFDQWVLRKTHAEILEAERLRENQLPKEHKHPLTDKGKTFEEWRRDKAEYEKHLKDAEKNKWKEKDHGRTSFSKNMSFEKWKKEKEEFEKAQKAQDLNEERQPRESSTFMKGKTFEQWRLEDEERMRKEQAVKLEKQKRAKEANEKKTQQRRKESVASYQKWLRDKEQAAEMQRKKSQAMAAADIRDRKRSEAVTKPQEDGDKLQLSDGQQRSNKTSVEDLISDSESLELTVK